MAFRTKELNGGVVRFDVGTSATIGKEFSMYIVFIYTYEEVLGTIGCIKRELAGGIKIYRKGLELLRR